MIRWRPYWIWTRKRQIIYEETPKRRKKRRPAPAPVMKEEPEEEDPFAAFEDPYAPKKAAPANDMAEWDSADDPYARPAAASASREPHFYGRPKLGKGPEPK